jgi:hypothetical protein
MFGGWTEAASEESVRGGRDVFARLGCRFAQRSYKHIGIQENPSRYQPYLLLCL